MDTFWRGKQETNSAAVRETVHVYVEYSTEDEDYGPVYVASCLELDIVTYGKTLDELLANLRDAIASHLSMVDPLAQYNLIPNPRIMMMVTVNL